MRSPGAGGGGLGGFAAFGGARRAGNFRAGFLAGFTVFLRIGDRLAAVFLRFGFAFFLTAMCCPPSGACPRIILPL
jgi:hypothetical protein